MNDYRTQFFNQYKVSSKKGAKLERYSSKVLERASKIFTGSRSAWSQYLTDRENVFFIATGIVSKPYFSKVRLTPEYFGKSPLEELARAKMSSLAKRSKENGAPKEEIVTYTEKFNGVEITHNRTIYAPYEALQRLNNYITRRARGLSEPIKGKPEMNAKEFWENMDLWREYSDYREDKGHNKIGS